MSSANSPADQVKRIWTLRVLLTLILLIAGVYLYKGIESYEKVTNIGFNQEARQQPFLAAKMFLESNGTQVALLADYRLLYANNDAAIYPATDDTVILTEGEIALSNGLASKLLEWVKSGGHLIIALNASQDADVFRANGLIQQLKLDVEWLAPDTDYAVYPTEIINPDDLPLMVNLENSYRLALPDNPDIFYSAGDDHGTTFAQMQMADGLITILTEVYIWNNYQIADEDNVVLLEQLVANSSNVYIFSSRELPHWFSLLYKFAPYFICFGGVLLLLSLWHWAIRFGPILKIDEHKYTPFSQHIKAAGEFYWRYKRQLELLKEIRHSIIVALHKKRPASKTADQKKLCEQLSLISGWPIETINTLMFSQTQVNETQFTQRIASLQALRKML